MVSHVPSTVVRRTFGPDDKIGLFIGTARAVWYRCVETNAAGHRFQRLDDPSDFQTFSHEDVAGFERSEGYRYVAKGQNLGNMLARKRGGVAATAYLPQKDRPVVLWRLDWVDRFIALEKEHKHLKPQAGFRKVSRSQAGLNEAIGIIAGDMEAEAKKVSGNRAGATVTTRKPPCYKSLLQWVVDYEDACKNPLALRNGHWNCGKNHPKLRDWVEELMEEYARKYLSTTKRTKAHFYGAFRDAAEAKIAEHGQSPDAKAPKIPCDKTFDSRIDRLRAFDVAYARDGKGRSRKKFYAVWEHITALMPGERIEIDEWELPLMSLMIASGAWAKMTAKERKVVKRARLWVSVAIDVATRCILAMLLSQTPTADLAVRTIAMVFADKSRLAASMGALSTWHMRAGLGTVVTDMGSAYVAAETRFAVVACGGNLYHPPGGLAQHRPYIERFFGSVHTRVVSLFTGRTFEDVKAKGDYDAVGNASIVVAETAQMLVRHVVDDYHNTPHPGLDGETPAREWRRRVDVYGTVPLPDPHTIRNAVGEERHCGTGPRGVRCNNLYYQSPALQEFRRKVGDCKVPVLFDRENLGFVSVLIGDENDDDGGWLTVPCAEQGYDGVRADDYLREGADRRRRQDVEQVEDAKIAKKARADISGLADSVAQRAGVEIEPTDAELRHANRALDFGRPPPPESVVDMFADLILPPPAPDGASRQNSAAPGAAKKNPPRPGRQRRSAEVQPQAPDSAWTVEKD
jgi:putative transposase